MTPITAKAGDAIRIEKQLTEGSGRDGTPVDLTGETVRVYVQFDDNALVANQEVEYVDRATGKIAVELQPSQTSNIGRHNIEWVVDPQGDPTTFPKDSYDTLRTESPLDRELNVSEETPPDLTVTTLTVEGDADLRGGDLTGVGALESETVNTDDLSVKNVEAVYQIDTTVSLPNDTTTEIDGWTAVVDDIGTLSNSVAWSPNKNGVYAVIINLSTDAILSGSTTNVFIELTGSVTLGTAIQHGSFISGGDRAGETAIFYVDMSSSESITVRVRQRSGSEEALGQRSRLQIQRVG